jgi:hypothetical protein
VSLGVKVVGNSNLTEDKATVVAAEGESATSTRSSEYVAAGAVVKVAFSLGNVGLREFCLITSKQ